MSWLITHEPNQWRPGTFNNETKISIHNNCICYDFPILPSSDKYQLKSNLITKLINKTINCKSINNSNNQIEDLNEDNKNVNKYKLKNTKVKIYNYINNANTIETKTRS